MDYNVNDIPGEPGYYALFIKIGEKKVIRLRSGKTFTLEPGIYVYIGSAQGPGGLRARIRRHLDKNKPVHWHIDYLTTLPEAQVLTAVSVTAYKDETGDIESLIAGRLAGEYKGIEGFGSTDKPKDKTHLFYCGKTMREYEECLWKIVGYMREAATMGSGHKYSLRI